MVKVPFERSTKLVKGYKYETTQSKICAPNLRPLDRSGVRTQDEEFSLVLERLLVLLADRGRPRVCSVRLDGVHFYVNLFVRSKDFREHNNVKVRSTAEETASVLKAATDERFPSPVGIQSKRLNLQCCRLSLQPRLHKARPCMLFFAQRKGVQGRARLQGLHREGCPYVHQSTAQLDDAHNAIVLERVIRQHACDRRQKKGVERKEMSMDRRHR